MAQNTSTKAPATGMVETAQDKKRVFRLSLVLVVVIVAAIFSIAFYRANTAETEFEEATLKTMRENSLGQAADIYKWLGTAYERGASFVNSGVINKFAPDVDSGNLSVMGAGSSHADDISFLQTQLNNLVAYSDFNFGGILSRNGEMYLNTDPAFSALSSAQKNIASQVAESGEVRFAPIRQAATRGLLLEMYMPVADPASGRSIAVLYLTLPVSSKFNDFVTVNSVARERGYASFVLQKNGDEWQEVSIRTDKVRNSPPMQLGDDGNIVFGIRDSIVSTKRSYSFGAKVKDLNLWVLWEQDYNTGRADLDAQIKSNYIFSALGALALILLVSFVWRLFISMERSQTLNKFQELFKVIEEQKILLDSINGTIAEPISLTDAKGIFRYVNYAFADAFGRDVESIMGLDTAAVCGFDTAKRLNSSDQHVLMTGESITTNEVIWLQSKRHYFQISKSPLKDPETQAVTGIVAVYRDVTQLVEAQEHSHRVVQQTIDALVQTIEQADPFLGGHSRVMGEAAKLICKALGLSEKDTATIETAATLSQIGKMFVPREVLTKPGILTPEEKKVMEEHVEHTLNILSNIEFDLPVLDAIAQMNERLDGKGYPKGLSEDQITMHGRVLAIANAFAAMARPRSYRPAMDVETVLSVMDKQQSSYDPSIVAVLRDALNTPAGEKLVAQAASSKPV
ncbi:PAS domain-containing protein [Desulfovibrio sp. OttesenSCG-928-F07]|nr:PAS domain-containing protein [Desulfovibrio sp. OttesenSCG-928-F07]